MQVIITPKAQKELLHLPKDKKEVIKKKIDAISESQFESKKLKGELNNFYSVRVWPYRIIYEVIKNEIWIVHILHRQGAYK